MFVQPAKPVPFSVMAVEFLGLFAITYAGSWAVILADLELSSGSTAALVHALMVMVATWIAQPVSGAHLNPAVTLGLVMIKKLNWTPAAVYLLSQFAGAVAGALFIFIQQGQTVLDRISGSSLLGIPSPREHDFEFSGFWGEAIGGFLIMFVYMSLVLEARRNKTETIGAVALAFAIYASSLTVGASSGAGFNPARSLGPAIIIGKISKMQFVHFFSPIIGAIGSALLFVSLYVDEDDDERDELPAEVMGSGFGMPEPTKDVLKYSQAEAEELQ